MESLSAFYNQAHCLCAHSISHRKLLSSSLKVVKPHTRCFRSSAGPEIVHIKRDESEHGEIEWDVPARVSSLHGVLTIHVGTSSEYQLGNTNKR